MMMAIFMFVFFLIFVLLYRHRFGGDVRDNSRFHETEQRAQIRGIPTNRCKFMTTSDKKFLAIMPKLNSGRVDMLLEDVIGCRWTISVLRAVSRGVRRPGALERHIAGISAKVLGDRLKHFTKAGIFERVIFPEIPPRVEYRLSEFGKKFLRLLKEAEKLQADLDGRKS
jgi:DNA-binding HxlR family transcriptional regulator